MSGYCEVDIEEEEEIKTYQLPKTLYLNLRRWRCGGDKEKVFDFRKAEYIEKCPHGNKLGKGPTALRNNEGYCCCLGLFAQQSGVPNKCILGVGEPENIDGCYIEGMSDFSKEAIEINDDSTTTVKEKIAALRELLKKHGHRLVVKARKKKVKK